MFKRIKFLLVGSKYAIKAQRQKETKEKRQA